MPTTIIIAVSSVLALFALLAFLEVVYITVKLTRRGAYKDPGLLHIMVFTYFSMIMSLFYPTITFVLIMGEDNLNPILSWSMLTIQRVLLVQYPMLTCMSYIWDTLSIYYPLKCLYWKTTRRRELAYVIALVASSLAVISRCLQVGLVEGSQTDSVDGLFFPTRLDGILLLFTQFYIFMILFVVSQWLIFKVVKNNILKIIKNNIKQQVGQDKKNDLKRITRQFIMFGVGLCVAWTVFFTFFHIEVFCEECLPDKILTFAISLCFSCDMITLPIMIGANVKVAKILKSAVKRDMSKFLCCRNGTDQPEENHL